MPVALSSPSWKCLAIPLFMTFGLPFLTPIMMLSQSWTMPSAFPMSAGVPILALFLAYVYFPCATVRRRLFKKNNTLKSVLLGLAAFEAYRQLLVSVFKATGTSSGALIDQHCSGHVEALQSALACGAAASATQLIWSLLLWLAPAALLCSVSRRHLPAPLERGAV